MTVKWAEEFMKENPGVRIDISAGGAGKGMTDVLSGMVDLAMFSREVMPAEIEKGAWFIAVTKDAVLPTFNDSNPMKEMILKHGLDRMEFMDIFLDAAPEHWNRFFPGGAEHVINVYIRSDACGAAEMWGKYLGKNQESLEGIGVFGDPGMADAVKNDIMGLGFNNVGYAFDMKTRKEFPGLRIVPIDLDGNGLIGPEESFYGSLDSVMAAIEAGRYPSPPARELYLISNGKPESKVVTSFLEFILHKGQDYVAEAGYVGLSRHRIGQELDKIK
jgi:phosphate transport system substrate-binding protein